MDKATIIFKALFMKSISNGFNPTLAIVFISIKQDRNAKTIMTRLPRFRSSFSTRVRLRRNKSIIVEMQLGSKKSHTAINHVLFKIPVTGK